MNAPAVRLALILLCAALGTLRAQDLSTREGGQLALRERVVLNLLERLHPCPNPVPAAWLRPDTTLGVAARCALIGAAAERLTSAADSLPGWIAAHATCTHVVAFRFEDVTGRTEITSYWAVDFIADSARTAGAIIDRQTGEIRAGRMGNEFAASLKQLCGVGGLE